VPRLVDVTCTGVAARLFRFVEAAADGIRMSRGGYDCFNTGTELTERTTDGDE
jgi:hypothetical protein